MLVSDNLVYVELHKTGSTHISAFLKKYLEVEELDKHGQITQDLLDSGRQVLGSIRNPWEWYVSLWAYGCDRRGGLHRALTRPDLVWQHGLDDAPDQASKLGYLTSTTLRGTVLAWRRAYSKKRSPENFRKWIRMLYGPTSRDCVPEGYGFSQISKVSGLLTYRYLRLYSTPQGKADTAASLDSHEAIAQFDREYNFCNRIIRNESLTDDMISVIREHGGRIDEEEEASIRSAPRANTSGRSSKLDMYYDDETRALVAEREKHLIDRFEYSYA